MAIVRLENGLGKNLKRAENNLNSTKINLFIIHHYRTQKLPMTQSACSANSTVLH